MSRSYDEQRDSKAAARAAVRSRVILRASRIFGLSKFFRETRRPDFSILVYPCLSSLVILHPLEISLTARSEQSGSSEANDVLNKIIYSLIDERAIYIYIYIYVCI